MASERANWREYLYLRKSRDEEKDPEVLGKHRKLLARLAAQEGIAFRPEDTFEEIGSAELIEQRPAFQRLLAAWDRLPRDAGGRVWVTELSRLSRGRLSQQGRVEDAVTRAGILIQTPGQRYDLAQPDDQFAFNAHLLVSRWEFQLTKQRLARGKADLLQQGRIRNAKVPYGYEWIAGQDHPVAIPEELAILRLLCRDALSMSTYALAERYRLPRHRILQALKSPIICGWPAERYRTAEGKRGVKLLPREEWRWPEQPGEYPAACTREEWEAIQSAMQAREKGRERRGAAPAWCRDVVRFMGHAGRVAAGTVHSEPVYELHRQEGSRLYIARAGVHAAAEETLHKLLTDANLLRRGLDLYMARRGEKRSSKRADGEALAREVERLRAMDEGAIRRELQAEIDGDREGLSRLSAVRGELRRDLARAKTALEAIRREQLAIPEVESALPVLQLAADRWQEAWAMADEEQRRLFARAFLAAVNVETAPVPGERRWRREVRTVEVRDLWLV